MMQEDQNKKTEGGSELLTPSEQENISLKQKSAFQRKIILSQEVAVESSYGDRLKVKSLEKEIATVQKIAKTEKRRAAQMEKDIDRLEKENKDYKKIKILS